MIEEVTAAAVARVLRALGSTGEQSASDGAIEGAGVGIPPGRGFAPTPPSPRLPVGHPPLLPSPRPPPPPPPPPPNPPPPPPCPPLSVPTAKDLKKIAQDHIPAHTHQEADKAAPHLVSAGLSFGDGGTPGQEADYESDDGDEDEAAQISPSTAAAGALVLVAVVYAAWTAWSNCTDSREETRLGTYRKPREKRSSKRHLRSQAVTLPLEDPDGDDDNSYYGGEEDIVGRVLLPSAAPPDDYRARC